MVLPTASSTVNLSIPTILRRAGEWFLESGIQEPHGGVARHYRVDLRRNSRISTEITGYAVSTFCYLNRITGEEAYKEAALRAGRFLVTQIWDKRLGIFPFEWPSTAKPEENRAYFFDCGIIVRGLIALWRMTNEREFLEIAVTCGQGMADRFKEFTPILQLPGCEILPRGASWSNNPGCYQLKSGLGWFELWEATGDAVFRSHYERALESALADDDAFLPGDADRLRVVDRLHAYGYFLEGLLAVADREECATRIHVGIRKMAHYLRESRTAFVRSDVYAQLLRVRLYAEQLGVVTLDHAQAGEEADAIPGFSWNGTDDRHLDGGFCFGFRARQRLPYANPVSTAFCMQALALWQARQRGAIQGTWRDLI